MIIPSYLLNDKLGFKIILIFIERNLADWVNSQEYSWHTLLVGKINYTSSYIWKKLKIVKILFLDRKKVRNHLPLCLSESLIFLLSVLPPSVLPSAPISVTPPLPLSLPPSLRPYLCPSAPTSVPPPLPLYLRPPPSPSAPTVSSLGRYVFGSEISYNTPPPRLPGLGC